MVVPCYNEESCLPLFLPELARAAKRITCELRDELLGIQLGEVEDPHNWMWKVC